MARYQVENIGVSESQLEMTRKIHLKLEDLDHLSSFSEICGIKFACTSFGPTTTEYLKKFTMPFVKIPSGEITNIPYIDECSEYGIPIIVSTGMSTIGEIEYALNRLRRRGVNDDDITLMHCTTQYPAPFGSLNLSAINTLRSAFRLKVGYSDHSLGLTASIGAVAMGACTIEKHLTLCKDMQGPDHRCSLEPHDFSNLVIAIRDLEEARGSGIKEPHADEIENIQIARRSIVAKKMVKKGELFTIDNLTTKRPGDGISAIHWDLVVGKRAIKDFYVDEQISF